MQQVVKQVVKQVEKRSNEVDVIRMMALWGIGVVNIHFSAMPAEVVFAVPAVLADQIAAFAVETLFQLKFFLLFSFIFGWGMAIQQQSSAARPRADGTAGCGTAGQPQLFASRYFRRMAGLACIGVAHAILVFSGDILLMYALLGSLLYLIKDYSARRLLRLAGWMLLVSICSLTLLGVILAEVQFSGITAMSAVGAAAPVASDAGLAGSFFAATQARLADWPLTFGFLLLLQGPLAFAAFAAGLAAAKTDFFSQGSVGDHWLQQRWPLLLAIALPLNAWYAAVMGGLIAPAQEWLSLAGLVVAAIAAPALSLVYLRLLLWFARAFVVPPLLLGAGKNTLSCYVLQGVIAGWIFGGYGLGLFGDYGQLQLLWLALAIALASMLLVGLYAKKFGRGPLESLLRWISGRS